ncbi:M56 family metallopeptidase [Belliella marina]|uniref:M56 family metallopeptidase n=1 Tax=Belliella marina TaxID=1644146 RepID=A0ABW4VNL7_9BACT
MEWINEVIPDNYLYAIGWMLVHSLWQISGLGLLLWLVLEFYHKKSASFKYWTSVFVLFLLVLGSIGTAIFYFEPQEKITAANEPIFADDNGFHPISDLEIPPHTTKSNFEAISSQIEKRIPTLVNLWLIGAVLFMIKFASSLAELRSLDFRPKNTIGEKWEETLADISSRLKIKQRVQIFQTKFVDTPVTYGILKPVILIPTGLIFKVSPAQLEAIIAHELAHIKRHDYLINLIQSVMEVVFFFHPVFWYINSIIKTERENTCDDLAISVGIKARDLAEALVIIVNHAKQTQPELAMAAAKPKTPTLDRIKRIMGFHSSHKQTSTLTSLTMIITLILSASLILGAHADKSSENDFDPMLTQAQSNIILTEGFWSQFDIGANANLNTEKELADNLKLDLGKSQKGSSESLRHLTKTLSNLSNKLDSIKSYDLKISLSENGKTFSFEDMTEKDELNLFSGFDNFKITGDTLHIWSDLKGNNSKIKAKSLNGEALAHTIKIPPLEFQRLDFSEMPMLKLPEGMIIPHVNLDSTKEPNLNEAKIRMGYDTNELHYKNSELAKVNEDSPKTIQPYNPAKIQSIPKAGSISNPTTFSLNLKDTTDLYAKELAKATDKLSKAKTVEEKEKAKKEISALTDKIRTLTREKHMANAFQNDSLMATIKKQADMYRKKAEELKPLIKEYENKMREWQKQHEPLLQEYEAKMKAYEKELQPLMKEYQEKMKAYEKELQPLMKEYQQKMEEWQKEYSAKMQESKGKPNNENN